MSAKAEQPPTAPNQTAAAPQPCLPHQPAPSGSFTSTTPPLRRHVAPPISHCHTPPRGDAGPRIQVREGVLSGRLANLHDNTKNR